MGWLHFSHLLRKMRSANYLGSKKVAQSRQVSSNADPLAAACCVVKGRFTQNMRRPCRSNAAKSLQCVFPIWFTHRGRVWFTLAMPRPCYLQPRRSSQGHGTIRPWTDGLCAISPRSASSGYHAEFHEGCYETHTNLRRRWPVWNQTFVMDEEKRGSSTLQKRHSVKLLD
jgi:hypothetical protein